MKKEIFDILNKHVEVYASVSVERYKEERRLLHKNDVFSDFKKLESYNTILTVAIPYPSLEVKWQGKGYGILSRYSYNIDYHIVFRGLLRSIEEELSQLGIKSYSSVDVSFVDERYAAYLSGIGYLGKNQFLINKTYGTYLYLATILIDKDIEEHTSEYDSCFDCDLCIKACPSNALDNGFDEKLCISSVSQMKKELSETEIKHFKSMIYGCDICQKVCPKNKGIDFHLHKEFEPSGIENINIVELLDMSNKEYKMKYGNNASSWRGATIIKRNALCLIANQGLTQHREKIVKSMADFKDVLWYNKTAINVLNLLDRE
jgi:epoxyqueuosine reductase